MSVSALRFSQLSPARQKLVRLCQKLDYGSVEGLMISNGQPVFGERSPAILADVKLDGGSPAQRCGSGGDFELCSEFCRLMAILDEVREGSIASIQVRGGVARRVLYECQITSSHAGLRASASEVA